MLKLSTRFSNCLFQMNVWQVRYCCIPSLLKTKEPRVSITNVRCLVPEVEMSFPPLYPSPIAHSRSSLPPSILPSLQSSHRLVVSVVPTISDGPPRGTLSSLLSVHSLHLSNPRHHGLGSSIVNGCVTLLIYATALRWVVSIEGRRIVVAALRCAVPLLVYNIKHEPIGLCRITTI